MRPILVLALIILLSASAYYDLKVGTIPNASSFEINETSEATEIEENTEERSGEVSLPYEEILVEAGQTVYGIVKSIHEEHDLRLTRPPHIVVEDFEALNPNVQAHQIIIGHTYRFPLYPPSND